MNLKSSFSDLHRRSVEKGGAFVAKLWMGIALLSMVINLFIVLTIWQISPQLEIISQIVFQDALTSRQAAIAEPFDAHMMDQNKINEMLVRYYLENRYGVLPDYDEMMHRWGGNGILDRLSTDNVYYPFFQTVVERLEQIDKEVETSSIDIRKISRLDNTWTIELEVFTFNQQTGQLSSRVYDIVLETAQDPSYAFYNVDFINPYGLQIVDFRQTQKKQ